MVHFVEQVQSSGSDHSKRKTVSRRGRCGDLWQDHFVNPQILDYTKDVCTIYNSAKMTLEDVISVIEKAEAAGKTTVRLHTGDPCIYGAIREQMDILDEKKIAYDYCPGVVHFVELPVP